MRERTAVIWILTQPSGVEVTVLSDNHCHTPILAHRSKKVNGKSLTEFISTLTKQDACPLLHVRSHRLLMPRPALELLVKLHLHI